eukprot:jgi/Mesvir1/3812/Mv25732-RA.1
MYSWGVGVFSRIEDVFLAHDMCRCPCGPCCVPYSVSVAGYFSATVSSEIRCGGGVTSLTMCVVVFYLPLRVAAHARLCGVPVMRTLMGRDAANVCESCPACGDLHPKYLTPAPSNHPVCSCPNAKVPCGVLMQLRSTVTFMCFWPPFASTTVTLMVSPAKICQPWGFGYLRVRAG